MTPSDRGRALSRPRRTVHRPRLDWLREDVSAGGAATRRHPACVVVPTIVGTALVVVLALATAYHSGSAFKQVQEAATAATFILQSEQVLGASQLYRAAEGSSQKMDALVSKHYLTSDVSIPTSTKALNNMAPALVPTAYAAATAYSWSTVTDSVPQYWVPPSVTEATCRAINLKARGDNGIYTQAIVEQTIQ